MKSTTILELALRLNNAENKVTELKKEVEVMQEHNRTAEKRNAIPWTVAEFVEKEKSIETWKERFNHIKEEIKKEVNA